MEKIKASEILAMNPELSLEKIQGFVFFAIDKDGESYLYQSVPYLISGCCFDSMSMEQLSLGYGFDNSKWKESVREIDFKERQQETQEHLYHRLFLHMTREHDLNLTNEQLYEIVLLAKKIKLPHEENL